MDANKTAGEEARWQLHKNAACNPEQVLAATPHKTPTVLTLVLSGIDTFPSLDERKIIPLATASFPHNLPRCSVVFNHCRGPMKKKLSSSVRTVVALFSLFSFLGDKLKWITDTMFSEVSLFEQELALPLSL